MVAHNPSLWETRPKDQEFKVTHGYMGIQGSFGCMRQSQTNKHVALNTASQQVAKTVRRLKFKTKTHPSTAAHA